MVQFLKNLDHEKVTALQSAFAGGAAGAVTRAIIQPFDVLKIRFQLQVEPIKHGSKYASVLQATSSIIREEGISTLWSGHIPAQLLSITFGVIQFSTFEELLDLCYRSDPEFFDAHKHGIDFSCGAVAACMATFFSFPFDTLRTRLIAEEKTHKAYGGISHACSDMIRKEGPRSLFKGLIPTLAQIAPHAGIQFTVYKLFTERLLNKIPYFQRRSSFDSSVKSSLVGNLIGGSIAGFVAKSSIYPFDVVKKRLQIQGFQQHRKGFGKQIYCNGIFHCIRVTVSEEGLLALYKGYWPSMLKAVVGTALHFSAYDEIKNALLGMNS